jgi:hypothetical protein
MNEPGRVNKRGTFASIVLRGSLGFLVVVLAYQALHYQMFAQGIFLIFLIIPSALFLCLLLALYLLDNDQKVRLALAICATALAVYGIEAVFAVRRAAGGVGDLTEPAAIQNALAAKKSGRTFDTRVKVQVVTDFRDRGLEVYPVAAMISTEIDGKAMQLLGGISRVKTLYCNESGTYTIYDSDEHGFNNPAGLHGAEIEVVALGDSFAQGACVAPEQNAVALIRGKYLKTLNLGIGGMAPLAELAAFREYAEPLKPKVVVWFYYEGNDLVELAQEKENPILRRYLDPEFRQDLRFHQAAIDEKLISVAETQWRQSLQREASKNAFADKVPFWNFLMLYESRLFITQRDWQRQAAAEARHVDGNADLGLLEKVLILVRDCASAWRGRVLFVYVPEYLRLKGQQSAEKHRKAVLDMVRRLQITSVDIYPILMNKGDPLSLYPFRLPNHFNAEGYREIADALLPAITELIEGPDGN